MDVKPQLRLAANRVSQAATILETIAGRFHPHHEKRLAYLAQNAKLNDIWHELHALLTAED